MSCNFCGKKLSVANFVLIQNKVYKSCPECSKASKEHIYYDCPEAFGTTKSRSNKNDLLGLQSHCSQCRSGKKGPHKGAVSCSSIDNNDTFIINEIRLLPMGKDFFKNDKDVETFILYTMPNRGGKYYFPQSTIIAPTNTLVFFQYDAKLVGYAIFHSSVKFDKPQNINGEIYNGYHLFYTDSITLFSKPLTSDDLATAYPYFSGFNQSKQKIPLQYLPAIFELLDKNDIITASENTIVYDEFNNDEVETLFEGAKKQITVNAYERNKEARKTCINYYKQLNNGQLKCEICGFDFGEFYGKDFSDKIHIHHVIEISSIGKEYKINPVTDLIPVCPNCHMIIHSKKPAYQPNEIKQFIEKKK